MEIILPKFGLFFWTLVVFLTVFFLLKKFAWGPILKALHEREHNIESKLKAAAEAEARMKALTAENEKILQQAQNERAKILKEAAELKAQIVADARKEAQAEAAKELANARRAIESEKAAALAHIKQTAVQLSIEVAEKILRAELSDKSKHEQFARRLIEDIRLN
ncbi:MAG: F0F1 ATP synthase subunit B [Bacteroidia bacterium]|nr:F0F1 ATP synthase subunit B [Bacteroidia bacterium]MDW8333615.1 F0F1 ATP synthase subunit B [Bacteroidia bacterium]